MGSYAYSENVMELLLTAFTKVSVGPFAQPVPASPVPSDPTFLIPDPVEEKPRFHRAKIKKIEEPEEKDDPLSMYGSGNIPKRPFKKGG
jgi:hypothetical protein